MAQPLEGEPAVGREGSQKWGTAQSLPRETGRDGQQETAAGWLSAQGLQGRGTWDAKWGDVECSKCVCSSWPQGNGVCLATWA